jgi:hypothetical protein
LFVKQLEKEALAWRRRTIANKKS